MNIGILLSEIAFNFVERMMQEIVTKTERIAMSASGVIVCKVLDNAFLDEADARENLEAVKQLAGGKRVPVFVDITSAKGVSKECRAYFAGKEASVIQCACALLVNTPLSRLVGNFFLGLNKTQFPTQLFTDEQKAMEWLKGYL